MQVRSLKEIKGFVLVQGKGKRMEFYCGTKVGTSSYLPNAQVFALQSNAEKTLLKIKKESLRKFRIVPLDTIAAWDYSLYSGDKKIRKMISGKDEDGAQSLNALLKEQLNELKSDLDDAESTIARALISFQEAKERYHKAEALIKAEAKLSGVYVEDVSVPELKPASVLSPKDMTDEQLQHAAKNKSWGGGIYRDELVWRKREAKKAAKKNEPKKKKKKK